jgi:hypothetical protein
MIPHILVIIAGFALGVAFSKSDYERFGCEFWSAYAFYLLMAAIVFALVNLAK